MEIAATGAKGAAEASEKTKARWGKEPGKEELNLTDHHPRGRLRHTQHKA